MNETIPRSRRDIPRKRLKHGQSDLQVSQRYAQDKEIIYIWNAPSEVSIVESELDLERTCLLVKPFCVTQVLDLCDVTRSALRKR